MPTIKFQFQTPAYLQLMTFFSIVLLSVDHEVVGSNPSLSSIVFLFLFPLILWHYKSPEEKYRDRDHTSIKITVWRSEMSCDAQYYHR